MKNAVKRAVAALTIVATAATGVTVAAGDAEAKTYGIANGFYTYKMKSDLFYDQSTTYSRAWVRGNTMTIQMTGKPKVRVHIHATRYGGYIDASGVRSVFVKGKNGRYTGHTYSLGFPTGRNTLIPR